MVGRMHSLMTCGMNGEKTLREEILNVGTNIEGIKMDRYWRLIDPFTGFRYASKMLPDMWLVGFIIHEAGVPTLKEKWDEMKHLVPEDYFLNYVFLEGEFEYGPTAIVFDTYEQAFALVDYFERHFNDDHMGYASILHDGENYGEST